jgi:predicted DNA-binding transcriptional regulator AlpA
VATGLSRSEIYRLMEDGAFPPPVRLNETGRSIGWISTEVMGFVFDRIRRRDEAQNSAA